MKARIAFLTSPAPNIYLFNFQEEGKDGICQVEISEAHLANIIVDGASYALRSHRVPETQPASATHERTTSGS